MTNQPFELPTLGGFVTYLREKGCFVTSEVYDDANGQPYTALVLKNNVGAWVVITNPDMNEVLTRSVLENHLRRLGLKKYSPEKEEKPKI